MNAANTNVGRKPQQIVRGAKYVSGQDIATIAKLVRKDLANLAMAGHIPATKYRVRISRYAGGQSLTVVIGAPGFPVVNEERVRLDVLEPYAYHERTPNLLSEQAMALIGVVAAVVDAYNFDGSDSQSDYFHVNFYAHVDFDGAVETAEREALKAKYAAQAEQAATAALARKACPAAWTHDGKKGCSMCE